MICEIFCSILSMGMTSNYTMQGGKSGICHGFIAINPANFGDPEAIKEHLSTYLRELRESPKAEGAERIYTHGEKEVEATARICAEGAPVNINTLREMVEFANFVGINPKKYFGKHVDAVKSDKMFSGNY